MFAGAPADPAKLEKVTAALGYLDKFLDGQTYVAGKNMTIADLSLIASVTTAEVITSLINIICTQLQIIMTKN